MEASETTDSLAPSRSSCEEKPLSNIRTASTTSLRMSESTAASLETTSVTSKQSLRLIRSTRRLIIGSFCFAIIATLTLRISSDNANPNNVMSTIGIPTIISNVRVSRKIWKNSFLTNASNCVIMPYSLRNAPLAIKSKTCDMEDRP